MPKLPASLRKAAQAALASAESSVPIYRLLDDLIENPKPLAALMEKHDLSERDLRDILKNSGALLRLLEEMLEAESSGATKTKKNKDAADGQGEAKSTDAPLAAPAEKKSAPITSGKPDPAALARIAQAKSVKIFTDGACSGNPGPMGIAYVMLDADGNTLWEEGRAIGVGTNNVAEYSALIMALKKAREFGKKAVICFSDSELMVKQIRGEYRVKTPGIVPLIREVQALRREFEKFQISHIRREQNSRADALASGAIRGRR